MLQVYIDRTDSLQMKHNDLVAFLKDSMGLVQSMCKHFPTNSYFVNDSKNAHFMGKRHRVNRMSLWNVDPQHEFLVQLLRQAKQNFDVFFIKVLRFFFSRCQSSTPYRANKLTNRATNYPSHQIPQRQKRSNLTAAKLMKA